jgi:hypothetical protein
MSHFHSIIILVGNARVHLLGSPTNFYFLGRLLALLKNIRKSWKWQTHELINYDHKKFIIQVSNCKNFAIVIYVRT